MDISIAADPDQRFSDEAADNLVGQTITIDVDGRPVGQYVVRAAETSEDGKVIRVSLSVKTH